MIRILFFSFYFFLHSAFKQINPKQAEMQAAQAFKEIQKSIDSSAELYISKLNCNSAIVTSTYFEQLLLDSIGNLLVELADKDLNRKLLPYLNDKSKVLAIHIILTKRLEHETLMFRAEYVYHNKNIIRVNYSCNNFNWYYLIGENNRDCFFNIDDSEINKIKYYWTEKLKRGE